MGALAAALQRFSPTTSSVRIGPIGLEFALNELHLVQMQVSTDGSISAHAMATVPFPEACEDVLATPKRLRQLVQRGLASDHFQGRHVVSTLPPGATRIMPVSYKVQGGQTDDAALVQILKDRIDGNLSEHVIDYLKVRTDRQSEERLAIVAIAGREATIRYLENLRQAGLTVDRLDVGPSAIRRLVGAMREQDNFENVIAINFGRFASYLTVTSGQRLLFDQEIQIGEVMLLEEIAGELDMPVEAARELVSTHSLVSRDSQESGAAPGLDIDVASTLQEIIKPTFMHLAEEINRVLIYTASETRGEPISRVYLLGSIARWGGMDHCLGSMLKLPVETIPNPLKAFGRDDTSRNRRGEGPRPEIAVATGLALSGILENE